MSRRTPQGVRGLKPVVWFIVSEVVPSHSARSAWIETPSDSPISDYLSVALRKECVD